MGAALSRDLTVHVLAGAAVACIADAHAMYGPLSLHLCVDERVFSSGYYEHRTPLKSRGKGSSNEPLFFPRKKMKCSERQSGRGPMVKLLVFVILCWLFLV